MSEPFVAQISIFGFNFAPKGWALCQGQLLPISQNTALFSLLGTMYGGDGRVTFGLPDFQDRVPLSFGQGAGLEEYLEGAEGGAPTVTLTNGEMPIHNHSLNATSANGAAEASSNGQPAKATSGGLSSSNNVFFYSSAAPNTQMSPSAIGVAGGGQPHNNMQPFLTLNFCIALQGVFPARP